MPTIAIVGDIFLQGALPHTAELAAVREALRGCDIAFGNLEAPVSNGGAPADKWINMRMPPALLDGVRDLGLDVLTLANNHMWDFGEEAFFDTLRHLDVAGLHFVGAGGNLDAAWTPHFSEHDGCRVAILGATSTLGPGSAAAEERPGVAPIRVSEAYHIDSAASLEQPGSAPYVHTRAWSEDLERACDAIASACELANYVIIALHWGVPPFWRSRFQDGLADYQVEVGHALIEAGADLVVGHHPHSLQPIEIYHGKPILYSLGNFVFHHNAGPVSDTPVSRHAPYSAQVDRRGRDWSETAIALVDLNAQGEAMVSLLPALLDEAGNPALLAGDEARALIYRLDAMSSHAAIAWRDGCGWLSQNP